ncbi:uncharacterized protein LOC134208936 [Armigeres subalbatus]|uniref:uncharacterized protein LOC134208936 n=1 Tax=Armigeres subalbatus TaxID=124917 RepID=UPI002ED39D91
MEQQQLQKAYLTSRRTTMITALGRAEAFVADFDEQRDQGQVAIRLEYLNNMWTTLEEVQGQLEDIECGEQANYNLAWQTLVDRYANEYLLKKRHLQALFEINSAKRETAASLHALVDEFQRHTKILCQLGEPTESWSTILEHLLCTKLPDDTLKAWEEYASTSSNPNYDCLIEFLQRRMRVLESILDSQFPCIMCFTSNSACKCPACNQDHHPLMKCARFNQQSHSERLRFVSSKHLCHNCLKSDHIARNCSSTYSCKHCRKRHHTMLHSGDVTRSVNDSPSTASSMSTQAIQSAASSVAESVPRSSVVNVEECSRVVASASAPQSREDVFLLTVLVKVVDAYGQDHIARVLLDSASQPNLITDRLARRLHLKRTSVNVTIQGAGNTSKKVKESIFARIKSRNDSFECGVDLLLINILTADLPAQDMCIEDWQIPQNLSLTDPMFNKSQQIVMVLVNNYSVEEHHCEDFFQSTTSRDETGRYIVRVPRKPDFDAMLGESKIGALRRFEQLERRLERDQKLKEEYHDFMREYLSLGHMRLVESDDGNHSHTYYLPHHPVIKEASTTTKVRVVFDGSARTSTGFSLNEALCVGPVVQDDLLAIILRFLTHPVALVGDIAKMYRQVGLHPDDCPLQRILFRFTKNSPVQTYELQTVTYGLSPSSFLATRALQQVASDEGNDYPVAGQALRKNFYVDDFIGGAKTIEEAIQLREELANLLLKGGFMLRKWTSNRLEVLQGLQDDQIGTQSSLQFTPNESIKALRNSMGSQSPTHFVSIPQYSNVMSLQQSDQSSPTSLDSSIRSA